jgi:hypothetical protein
MWSPRRQTSLGYVTPEIDGTGRVRGAVDTEPLIGAGQLFQMSMYHENHPEGVYQMTNRVLVFDPPRTIAWSTAWADDYCARTADRRSPRAAAFRRIVQLP